MTEAQIRLVKKTWRTIMKVDPKIVGDAFYSKLFNDHPGVRKMFPVDMEKQYIKLVDMLTTIVGSLDRPDDMTEKIREMSQRHNDYGVNSSHYKMVGDALIWTLKVALESEWNLEMQEAWIACYKILSDEMQAKQ